MTVAQLLQSVAPRVGSYGPQRLSLIESVNLITSVIMRHMVRKGYDLVKTDYSQTLTAADPTYTLPSDCAGLFSNPWLSGGGCQGDILPLPYDLRQKFSDPDYPSGPPQYYEVRGLNVTLYPTPDGAQTYTLVFPYHKRPSDAALLSDSVPFGGMFDDLYKDSVLKISAGGLLYALDQTFEAMAYRFVDQVMNQWVPKNIRFRRIV